MYGGEWAIGVAFCLWMKIGKEARGGSETGKGGWTGAAVRRGTQCIDHKEVGEHLIQLQLAVDVCEGERGFCEVYTDTVYTDTT